MTGLGLHSLTSDTASAMCFELQNLLSYLVSLAVSVHSLFMVMARFKMPYITILENMMVVNHMVLLCCVCIQVSGPTDQQDQYQCSVVGGDTAGTVQMGSQWLWSPDTIVPCQTTPHV